MTTGIQDPDAAHPPTTREGRARALLIAHTGDGKGKTTAAMGLALRAWATGTSVGVVQFVKSGRWPAGERAALAALDASPEGGSIAWYQTGVGGSWTPRGGGAEAADVARQGWVLTRDLLAERRHGLLILDEFTYAMTRGWVDVADVVETLTSRPGHQHVVVTGRACPQELLDVADLVTRMDKVTHPFDTGVRGQRGIDW